MLLKETSGIHPHGPAQETGYDRDPSGGGGERVRATPKAQDVQGPYVKKELNTLEKPRRQRSWAIAGEGASFDPKRDGGPAKSF